ncbi:helix-turn-helix domain-containing protein [Arthrobacter bambusae]|uniref:Sugar diacid utilization regulator/GAF domain-containing protein n=1 Tax=Arthrobacter bambusae TaxID=1338426 RepID=A0AAW8DD80_9MICC|nr:GAF domain-containing protein [Arthrobacter bambusae]MDP9905660.1 sugar diacid utilization regulator/GAF domain-containing protein [Arthrobacter bambusae]MDQ0127258.1 sugar diacid utilization regulator/GAF domain-containing protein [Arthrobacter bambusae]MDQ0178600.1 sugar diacid utilization regulator/GAF domain-containing protein [Arthrobacter bambusae]
MSSVGFDVPEKGSLSVCDSNHRKSMSLRTQLFNNYVVGNILGYTRWMTRDSQRAQGSLEVRRWLDSVRAITQTVVTAQPLSRVLDLIAETAAGLMGYEFCGVLLPDSSGQRLTIEGSSGLSQEYIDQVNADHPVLLNQSVESEAPSSKAFRTGSPVAIADIQAEPQFAPWGGVAREQGYRSMISVPLLDSRQGVIGTLNCYRRGTHDFGQQEIALLAVLADHAAIALTTSRLRSAEASRIDELVLLNRELHSQRDLLEKSEEIHQKLTDIALRGGGVPGIAVALSILIHRAVLIEDVQGAVIGRSDLDAVFPDDRTRTGIREEHSLSFVIFPVLLNESEVARIWTVTDSGPLTPIETRAVEHATVITSLEILRVRTAEEAQWRLQGEVLNDLLSGEPSALDTIHARAERLGHDLSVEHTMVGVSLSEVAQDDINVCLQQGLRRINAWASALKPRPLCAIHHDRIVVLLPTSLESPAVETTTTEKIRKMAASRRPRATATAVSRGPIRGLSMYPRAYRSAAGALNMLALAGRTDTSVTFDDLGLVGLLLQLDDSSQLLRYADRALGPVRSHDETRGTELLKTLRTYFSSGQINIDTARLLQVHPNTVAQRLRRIQTLTNKDLSRPDHAMDLAAALAIGDVADTNPMSAPAPIRKSAPIQERLIAERQ